MYEEFIHFVYRHKLWINDPLFLTSGEQFEIIDVGIPNYDSGPDFFNAKIKTGDTVWAGNVEIHTNSSDWYRHKHHKNLSYNNIILHIVFNNDRQALYYDGQEIPTWEIRFDHALFNNYTALKNNLNEISCANYIDTIDEFKIKLFIERTGIERIIKKVDYINLLLSKTSNDWEQAFYISLARNFGFDTNSYPFEQLALNTPVNIVRKYSGDIFRIESLLFGQSGLLEYEIQDEYTESLRKEYNFLKEKHFLNPLPKHIWKRSKLRPSNFPQVRIAQFAMLMNNFQGLFAAIIDEKEFINTRKFFNISPSQYWKNHYSFGKYVQKANTGLGESAFRIIVINTIVPFVYLYFKNFKPLNSERSAIDWLQKLKPENNRDTRAWEELGLKPHNAFESQALIYLKKNYCDLKKCLNCNFGYEIMKQISTL